MVKDVKHFLQIPIGHLYLFFWEFSLCISVYVWGDAMKLEKKHENGRDCKRRRNCYRIPMTWRKKGNCEKRHIWSTRGRQGARGQSEINEKYKYENDKLKIMVFPRKVHHRWLVSKHEDKLDLQCPGGSQIWTNIPAIPVLQGRAKALLGSIDKHTQWWILLYMCTCLYTHVNVHICIHTQG